MLLKLLKDPTKHKINNVHKTPSKQNHTTESINRKKALPSETWYKMTFLVISTLYLVGTFPQENTVVYICGNGFVSSASHLWEQICFICITYMYNFAFVEQNNIIYLVLFHVNTVSVHFFHHLSTLPF